MFGIHNFELFLISGILLNLTPGQDTLYILGRSIAQGRAAGVASVLGISTGAFIHTLAAVAGLSALLATSSKAFSTVKICGALYLIYLGIRMIFQKSTSSKLDAKSCNVNLWLTYRQGVITNVLNPKVALFFLAFMPQFVDTASKTKLLAFTTLGLTFITTGTLWCLCLVYFASRMAKKLQGSNVFSRTLNRAAGSLFIFLGLRLATTK